MQDDVNSQDSSQNTSNANASNAANVNNGYPVGASSLNNSSNALANSTHCYQVNEDSYASRAARTDGSLGQRTYSQETPRRHVNNDMPKRPRSAFFTPSRYTSARFVFKALKDAEILSSDIQCLQRKVNGEVVITLSAAAVK